MKVVHVITDLGSGGAERMLVRIATYDFGPARARQVVIALMDEGVHGATLRAAGIELHCLGMKSGKPSLWALLKLVRLLRRIRPDVVMTWLYHADFMGILAAPLAGVRRVIWNLRCSETDLSRYVRSTRLIVALLARMSGFPWLVAANSEAALTAHEALGYAPRRWTLLRNGFDLREWRADAADRVAVRAELGLSPEDCAFGMVARVDPQKDHATFLAAAAALAASSHSARFVLIGRDTSSLRSCEALGSRLVALGERRDVARLLRGLDVLVLSSVGESSPNVVGEAMATELPCVVTDVGDAADLVGDTGWLVAPQDAKGLAAAMQAALEIGAAQRSALGRAARTRIAEKWSIEGSAAGYAALWRTAVESQ